tara:strand:+ start:112 stop:645 length:534 start_codon:yes stop_codon:yes gene_type:complete
MKPRKVSDDEIAEIQRLFRYEDGKIFRIVFRSNNAKEGDRAGTGNGLGYRQIQINNRRYKEHRIVWMLVHGFDPIMEIDHINGNKVDNRIENLRIVTSSENQRAYRKVSLASSSKFRGVSWAKTRGMFISAITLGGTSKYIGGFTCEIEAAKAYDKKAIELGFDAQALNFPPVEEIS